MHTSDDENYQRGYEWWLMVEAKKVHTAVPLYATVSLDQLLKYRGIQISSYMHMVSHGHTLPG